MQIWPIIFSSQKASPPDLLHEKISPERKLIVLHTPKCGGTSLRASLRAAFGDDQFYLDYTAGRHAKVASSDEVKESIIYGHFPAVKYQHLDNAMWVTLLRHPVDRMLSLYFNWRYCAIEPWEGVVSALRRRVSLGKIGLLEFAALPAMSNRLSRVFFGGFDMRRFNLIILQDNYDEGVRRLGESLGIPLRAESRNVSSSRSEEYERERRRVTTELETMQRLNEILQEDIQFYERCVQLPSAVRR